MLRLDEVEYRVRRLRPEANTSIVFVEGYDFKEQVRPDAITLTARTLRSFL